MQDGYLEDFQIALLKRLALSNGTFVLPIPSLSFHTADTAKSRWQQIFQYFRFLHNDGSVVIEGVLLSSSYIKSTKGNDGGTGTDFFGLPSEVYAKVVRGQRLTFEEFCEIIDDPINRPKIDLILCHSTVYATISEEQGKCVRKKLDEYIENFAKNELKRPLWKARFFNFEQNRELFQKFADSFLLSDTPHHVAVDIFRIAEANDIQAGNVFFEHFRLLETLLYFEKFDMLIIKDFGKTENPQRTAGYVIVDFVHFGIEQASEKMVAILRNGFQDGKVIRWHCNVCNGFIQEICNARDFFTAISRFNKEHPRSCRRTSTHKCWLILDRDILFFNSMVRLDEGIFRENKGKKLTHSVPLRYNPKEA